MALTLKNGTFNANGVSGGSITDIQVGQQVRFANAGTEDVNGVATQIEVRMTYVAVTGSPNSAGIKLRYDTSDDSFHMNGGETVSYEVKFEFYDTSGNLVNLTTSLTSMDMDGNSSGSFERITVKNGSNISSVSLNPASAGGTSVSAVTQTNGDILVGGSVNNPNTPSSAFESPTAGARFNIDDQNNVTLHLSSKAGGYGLLFGTDVFAGTDFPCFCAGSMIQADGVEVAVEDIQVGDMIMTKDHGLKEVKWAGRSKVAVNAVTAPIVFAAGSIGNKEELRVSQQHQMLINDWRAEVIFGTDEVLVPAKKLVNGDTIYVDNSASEVEYFHFAFDQHEIVTANGVAAESFFIGETALKTLSNAQRAEIFAIFPELKNGTNFGEAAAYIANDAEASLLKKFA